MPHEVHLLWGKAMKIGVLKGQASPEPLATPFSAITELLLALQCYNYTPV